METRETRKKVYINAFIDEYKEELEGTIFTEKGQEMWIELAATNKWDDRKKDIKCKIDAFRYGILDAKKEVKSIKEDLNKIKAAN